MQNSFESLLAMAESPWTRNSGVFIAYLLESETVSQEANYRRHKGNV